MELFSNVLNILETKDKTHFFILLFVIFISMILEMLSIGLIVPIITLIINSSESFLNNYNFWLLEDILNKSKESQIMIVLSIFVTVYFLKSLYLTFLTIYLNTFSYNLKAKISKNLFQTYLNKKFNFFIENNSSILLRNIKDEPDLFVNQVFKPLLLLFVDCFLIVGIICVLIFYEPLISISVIILFLFIGTIFIKLTNKNITNQGLIRQKNDAQRIKNLTQAFNNIIEILILNVKKTILDKYNQPNSKSANATKINTIYQELPRVWLEMVGVAGILIVSSSMFYLDRNLDEIIPVLGLFSLAAFKILPTSNRILASLTSIKFGKPIIKIIKKNLQKKTLINKRNININFKKKIIFKNVSFSFSKKKNKKEIFKNLNLTIDKNSSVAIIGESGSGKSTLLNLLLGFFNPTSGKILIDNKDLNYISGGWLNNIGYVSQLTNIIDDSIKRNIAFGIEDHLIDKRKIFEVIKKSNLSNFVKKLPKGINTILGEKGVKISGGQRQRISIARALYNNPSLIIFDEATNALDVSTENNIIDEIIKLKKEKTVIFVTHRTNNLKKFDLVYKVSKHDLKKINL